MNLLSLEWDCAAFLFIMFVGFILVFYYEVEKIYYYLVSEICTSFLFILFKFSIYYISGICPSYDIISWVFIYQVLHLLSCEWDLCFLFNILVERFLFIISWVEFIQAVHHTNGKHCIRLLQKLSPNRKLMNNLETQGQTQIIFQFWIRAELCSDPEGFSW